MTALYVLYSLDSRYRDSWLEVYIKGDTVEGIFSDMPAEVPSSSLLLFSSLHFSDTNVYEPEIRALPGAAA